jgi:hypothetical protein
LFEAIERGALRPLPTEPYTIGEWKIERTVSPLNGVQRATG